MVGMGWGTEWNNNAGGAPQIYLCENIPQKRHEESDPRSRPLHYPSKVIREKSGHRLIKTWQGNFYDVYLHHGWRSMGRCMSVDEAISKWERWLRTQGVAE